MRCGAELTRQSSAALVAGLHRVQRTPCCDEQSLAVAAAEQQLHRSLWHVDCIHQLAGRIVDKHLPRGDINIPLFSAVTPSPPW